MSVLGSAIGAILAAMLEASVLSHLDVAGVKPDLVFALAIAVVTVLGFESGMAFALAGGLMLDTLLPERAVGATALVLVITTGLGFVVARVTAPPRLPVLAITTFGLGLTFQVLMIALLALTAGVAPTSVATASLAAVAVLDSIVAMVALTALRGLEARFGDAERAEW